MVQLLQRRVYRVCKTYLWSDHITSTRRLIIEKPHLRPSLIILSQNTRSSQLRVGNPVYVRMCIGACIGAHALPAETLIGAQRDETSSPCTLPDTAHDLLFCACRAQDEYLNIMVEVCTRAMRPPSHGKCKKAKSILPASKAQPSERKARMAHLMVSICLQ